MANRPQFLDSTLEPRDPAREIPPREPMLLLAHHPELHRVGETLLVARGVIEISRLSPSWTGRDGRVTGPLDDPFVSRTPFTVRRFGREGIEIANPGVDLTVGNVAVPAGGVHRVAVAELARGVPIVLANRILLWLTTDHEPRGADDLGLFGYSAVVHALRAAVDRTLAREHRALAARRVLSPPAMDTSSRAEPACTWRCSTPRAGRSAPSRDRTPHRGRS